MCIEWSSGSCSVFHTLPPSRSLSPSLPPSLPPSISPSSLSLPPSPSPSLSLTLLTGARDDVRLTSVSSLMDVGLLATLLVTGTTLHVGWSFGLRVFRTFQTEVRGHICTWSWKHNTCMYMYMYIVYVHPYTCMHVRSVRVVSFLCVCVHLLQAIQFPVVATFSGEASRKLTTALVSTNTPLVRVSGRRT